ncbi:MAG: ATP-dependent Clp protease proteolytic subunit [Clostridia bacterium]|nr:ATP-dependent Clp protease proteolytic subunit [Clostridia bacterium]MBO7169661.1 ATP-dependent Clp protease proteolytic subunit [Clostridia bacterium]
MQNTEKKEKNGGEAEDLFELGCATAKGKEGELFCLSIIGEIEGHSVLDASRKTTKYEHLLPLLFSLEEDEKITGILFLLNTLGGDVEAGLALAEVIASMKKPTVSLVLGGGHSIGVPLAVAAKRSFIVPSATMTVHPVRTGGLVLAVPQSFDYLERMQNRIIRFVTEHSRVDEGTFRRMMTDTHTLANDIGTLLEGEDAVACGLIDGVGGLKDALAALRELTKRAQADA